MTTVSPDAARAGRPSPGDLRRWLHRRRQPLRRQVDAVLAEWDRAGAKPGSVPGGEGQPTVGLALGRAHAALLDEMVGGLLVAAGPEGGLPSQGLCLAGVGGYGRGAVALGADLDLRLLAADLSQAQPVAEALLYPLWDSGMPVGHQVQTIDELIDGAHVDLPTATSLLDWRHVAGDRTMTEALLARAAAGLFSPSELPRFLGRLEAEAERRHGRFGGSVYLLEPDVKNGRGGLRDVDVARWAAQARWGVRELRELLRLGVLVERELAAVERARDRLWQIRNLLHAKAGRRSDRLSFDGQQSVARALGYGGPQRDAVERFMSDSYRAARTLSRFREAMLVRAAPRLARQRPQLRELGGGLQLFDRRATADVEVLRRQPAAALRLVAVAVEHQVPLLPHVRDAIVGLCEDAEWASELRRSSEAAALLVELVQSCADTRLRAGSTLRELHELGLLLAMIPEFSPVVGRVHHDTYHVYTVDVHSVAAVDRLVEIARGAVVTDEDQERHWGGSLASRLAAELTRPKVLFFATLLHDIGKAIGRGDHSQRGAEVARGVLSRLGFDAADVVAACRLIENHLMMYLVATRRDLDDPSSVADFAGRVGGGEALRHLYLLTVADLSTTSPTSMTAWKARMLDELFIAADTVLRGLPSADAGGRQRELAAVERELHSREAADGASPEERAAAARAFLASMPERYGHANPPEAIAAHAELARLHRADAASVALVPSRHPDVAELCVVAADRPGLLAAITAALSGCRLEVHAAQIHSRVVGDSARGQPLVQAVDLFWVRAGDRGSEAVERVLPRLRRELRRVLSGEVEPHALARRSGSSGRAQPEVPTEVVIDNRASPAHTVVEVFTRDRPGLLFALADAMYRRGLTIALAKINTEGVRVIDVFYVREQDGSKVCLDERAVELRKALLEYVAGLEEPGEES